MKKVICLIILICFLIFIGGITIYTLNHKGERQEVKKRVITPIEFLGANYNNYILDKNYNIHLNRERHKVKLEYTATNDGVTNVELSLYYDGKNIYKEKVYQTNSDINEVFKKDSFINYVMLNDQNFLIIKNEGVEYLIFKIGNDTDGVKEKLYLFNSNGDILINGLLMKDSTIKNNNKLYSDNYYVKIENNNIYCLEINKNEVLEYVYKINGNEIKKELID